MADRVKVKTVKNAILWSDGTITVQDVRISYPHLDKKWAKNEKDTPRYSATGILPLDTHKEAIDLIYETATGIVKDRLKGKEIPDNMLFIRDGAPTKKAEYVGAWIVVAGETDNRPIILNPDKSEMAVEDIKPTIKAGHYIDMLVDPWWQDNEHGKRVNASLRSVRYRREGPEIADSGISKDEAINSFDDDDDGGFGSGDRPSGGSDDDGFGGL